MAPTCRRPVASVNPIRSSRASARHGARPSVASDAIGSRLRPVVVGAVLLRDGERPIRFAARLGHLVGRIARARKIRPATWFGLMASARLKSASPSARSPPSAAAAVAGARPWDGPSGSRGASSTHRSTRPSPAAAAERAPAEAGQARPVCRARRRAPVCARASCSSDATAAWPTRPPSRCSRASCWRSARGIDRSLCRRPGRGRAVRGEFTRARGDDPTVDHDRRDQDRGGASHGRALLSSASRRQDVCARQTPMTPSVVTMTQSQTKTSPSA